jgi:hypothetical protein
LKISSQFLKPSSSLATPPKSEHIIVAGPSSSPRIRTDGTICTRLSSEIRHQELHLDAERLLGELHNFSAGSTDEIECRFRPRSSPAPELSLSCSRTDQSDPERRTPLSTTARAQPAWARWVMHVADAIDNGVGMLSTSPPEWPSRLAPTSTKLHVDCRTHLRRRLWFGHGKTIRFRVTTSAPSIIDTSLKDMQNHLDSQQGLSSSNYPSDAARLLALGDRLKLSWTTTSLDSSALSGATTSLAWRSAGPRRLWHLAWGVEGEERVGSL